MSRIVHISSDMNFGGVGRYLTILDEAILKKDDEVLLILPEGSVLKDKIKHMKIITCKGLNDQSFSLKAVHELYKGLKEIQPDLIHTHGALSGRIAGRLLKIPTVFTKHTLSPPVDGFKKHLKGWIHRFLKSKAVAISEGAYNNLITEGFDRDQIRVIYNGLKMIEDPGDVSNDVMIILFVGRLEPIKGPDQCLQMVEDLKNIYHKPFKVLIAGDGTMAPDLKKTAQEKDLPVEFLGHVDNIEKYYRMSDLVINTSYSEALGYSALEAMNYSKPVIAYNIPGIQEVVVDGVSGYLVEPYDTKVFAEKCSELFQDTELRNAMGKSGKVILKEKFSVDQMMDQLWSLYEEML